MTPEDLQTYTPAADLLRHRTVLVTGAAQGIGRAVAKACATHGATVVLLDRMVQSLEAVYDEITGAGHAQPAIYPMNLEGATTRDYADLATALEKEFGHLHGLVHNAAWVGGLTPIRHYDVEHWSRAVTVNLHAPFLLTRACLPLLEHADDPAIVFSTHDCARAYWGAYGAAKQGLEGLMKILAAELADDRPVRVNGIDTGAVNSKLWLENYPGAQPTGLPVPEDVAPAYLYLLGAESRGVTGQNFQLDLRKTG